MDFQRLFGAATDVFPGLGLTRPEVYTRYRPGIAPVLLNTLVLRLNYLHRQGSRSSRLRDFQEERWATRPRG
jgi:hypothetical protein